MNNPKILIIGACGQIGTELTAALCSLYGIENIIAADRQSESSQQNYVQLDVLDETRLEKFVVSNGVTQIYLLAAMLSASGEKNVAGAWNMNMQSLLSVLNIARKHHLDKIFWPSSIAVFGPGSPKYDCPQDNRIQPSTVYGISKRAGEHWCNYYYDQYGVDVRSLRFPGLISYTASPGGGTTNYAVDIFHQAIKQGSYECYIDEPTVLPMIYMPDAIRATLLLMNAPKGQINIRTSYNLSALNFAPCDLAIEIKKHIPDFKISYTPDSRQAIADCCPASIRDDKARQDWGWVPRYNLAAMTADMLEKLALIA